MKIATVRDLRNRYSSLLSWIGAGEEIVITRRGTVIARLIPENGQAGLTVDWSESSAVRRSRPSKGVLTAEESSAIIHESSSQW